MEEVKIYFTDLQFIYLVVQNAVEVLRLRDYHRGQFGGYSHLLAVAVLERFGQDALAVTHVVHVSGVQVVDAVIDGVAYHADS